MAEFWGKTGWKIAYGVIVVGALLEMTIIFA